MCRQTFIFYFLCVASHVIVLCVAHLFFFIFYFLCRLTRYYIYCRCKDIFIFCVATKIFLYFLCVATKIFFLFLCRFKDIFLLISFIVVLLGDVDAVQHVDVLALHFYASSMQLYFHQNAYLYVAVVRFSMLEHSLLERYGPYVVLVWVVALLFWVVQLVVLLLWVVQLVF